MQIFLFLLLVVPGVIIIFVLLHRNEKYKKEIDELKKKLSDLDAIRDILISDIARRE